MYQEIHLFKRPHLLELFCCVCTMTEKFFEKFRDSPQLRSFSLTFQVRSPKVVLPDQIRSRLCRAGKEKTRTRRGPRAATSVCEPISAGQTRALRIRGEFLARQLGRVSLRYGVLKRYILNCYMICHAKLTITRQTIKLLRMTNSRRSKQHYNPHETRNARRARFSLSPVLVLHCKFM